MSASLRIISEQEFLSSDCALEKFASFLGVPAGRVQLPADLSRSDQLQTILGDDEVLAVSIAALQRLLRVPGSLEALKRRKFLLAYGFERTGTACPELSCLTAQALVGVEAINQTLKTYWINAAGNGSNFPVCGQGYDLESSAQDCVFRTTRSHEQGRAWMTLNGKPKFIEQRFGQGTLFLLPDAKLVDLDQPLKAGASLRPFYAQLVALGMFLRRAFAEACWCSPVLGAAVTIDDPLLTRRYGFVEYETLLQELNRAEYSLTVAFIPYNFRRSDGRVAALARQHPSRFSIAVHGLDHTKAEFASTDTQLLYQKAWLALDRMERHNQETALSFDEVMIFPQGKFSIEAISALKRCGYLAAVNSTPWPVNAHVQELTVRDLLEVAVSRYDSFPVFSRRYPKDLFDFAFDAFFQKPLLLVEHHEFFREGYGALSSYVQRLRSLLGIQIKWQPLRQVLTSSFLVRQVSPERAEVKFFTPVVKVRNAQLQTCVYTLSKVETSTSVKGVVSQGIEIPFQLTAGKLTCQLELKPGEERELRVLYGPPEKDLFRPSLKYRCRTFARRRLSEVRDNFISKSPLLLTTAKRAKALLSERASLNL